MQQRNGPVQVKEYNLSSNLISAYQHPQYRFNGERLSAKEIKRFNSGSTADYFDDAGDSKPDLKAIFRSPDESREATRNEMRARREHFYSHIHPHMSSHIRASTSHGASASSSSGIISTTQYQMKAPKIEPVSFPNDQRDRGMSLRSKTAMGGRTYHGIDHHTTDTGISQILQPISPSSQLHAARSSPMFTDAVTPMGDFSTWDTASP